VNSHSVRPSETPDPLVGRILEDRYHVLQCIGKGGMGAVYLAEHVLLRRKVAIKTLHAPLNGSAESVNRFHREAVAAAAIGNQHVVEVTDMGQLENGAYYIALEYLDGADLGWKVVSEGRLGIARCLRIALQLCDALQAVHAAGIVHRDLKPENLFLIERAGNPEFLKVLDFGVCKFHEAGLIGGRRLTATGAAIGTPHYMAPEQIEGRADIDQRADIYAVGGILHFALTGDPPFDAHSLPLLFMRICQDPPPHLRGLRPEVSKGLERVVMRALAKLPEDRFADAAELREALLPLLAATEEAERRQGGGRRGEALARSGVRESIAEPIGACVGRMATRASGAGPSDGVSYRDSLSGRRRWPLRAAVTILIVLGAASVWVGLRARQIELPPRAIARSQTAPQNVRTETRATSAGPTPIVSRVVQAGALSAPVDAAPHVGREHNQDSETRPALRAKRKRDKPLSTTVGSANQVQHTVDVAIAPNAVAPVTGTLDSDRTLPIGEAGPAAGAEVHGGRDQNTAYPTVRSGEPSAAPVVPPLRDLKPIFSDHDHRTE